MKGYWKVFFILFSLFLLISLVKGLLLYKEELSNLRETRKIVEKTLKQNISLRSKMKYLQDKKHLERVIREKLNLLKKGEHVLIIPTPSPTITPTPTTSMPVFKKVLNFFF